jgi:hypothetical protein
VAVIRPRSNGATILSARGAIMVDVSCIGVGVIIMNDVWKRTNVLHIFYPVLPAAATVHPAPPFFSFFLTVPKPRPFFPPFIQ